MLREDTVWDIREVEQDLVDNLVSELDLTPIAAKMLVNRGYDSPKQAKEFLNCSIDQLHDPYLFSEMETVVNRIERAIDQQEKIVVYGDYDVDGITSSSLLLNYLKDRGAEVDFYIPNRLEEGYGLNLEAVEELAATGGELIITVDCGIKAHQELTRAAELGMDVIVTDHHTVPQELPDAVAIINPKRDDCDYPFSELAGVAVAFKVVQALELAKTEEQMPVATEYLALVTLGVVADIVPLRGENRIIVQEGLKQLNQLSKASPGLFALVDVTGYLDSEISVGHIAFGLAPRINACGRLGEPELGIELFLSQDYQKAEGIAQQMDKLNDQRQNLSQEMQEEAELLIEDLAEDEKSVVVLASTDWHSGVIGNVASDLNEKYYRPVVLLAIEEDGMAKGSARSIRNFNIYNALLANQDLLAAFGGHEQAAGLSIQANQISKLRQKLNEYARQELDEQDFIPRQRVDAAVDLDDLSFSLVEELNALAPFGYANPSPKLVATDVELSSYKLVGSNNDHLKLTAKTGQGRIDGIAFGHREAKAKLDLQSKKTSLLFNLEINSWRGRDSLQLKVKDIKVPTESMDQIVEKLATSSLDEIAQESLDALVQNENTLSILNPAQNKDDFALGFAAWQAIENQKMSLVVYPFKSILQQRYPIIAQRLSSLGLTVCVASSSLTASEEDELEEKLALGQCDLLLTTPHFLKTDVIDLEEIKSRLSFLIMEGASYFSNSSLAQPLQEVIAKLDDPLTLAVASSITKGEANKLLAEFDFDNKLISNYNKAPLELIDNRNVADKEPCLEQFLDGGKQTVIYVNTNQESQRLAANLQARKSDLSEQIIYYHDSLTPTEEQLARAKFAREEVQVVVATVAFNELLGVDNIEQVVFYEPCFNSYNFKYLANQAANSTSGQLHLLYQIEELTENKDLLKNSLPTRELLTELYLLLAKNKDQTGMVTINQQELLEELNQLLTVEIKEGLLVESLNIFVELDLIHRSKGEGSRIKLLDKPEQKLDLFTSMRYNECVVLDQACTCFTTLATKERDEILESITETYLLISKGEKNIEFNR
jgi:single-stranded-DNA-specific exonuclease RecJ